MMDTCETEARGAERPSRPQQPEPAAPGRPRATWRWWMLALAILTLAAGLRLWRLTGQPPTPDEMHSIVLLQLPRAERLAMLTSDVHPPLYYELQAAHNQFMQRALGRPPGLKTMRLLPVLLGLLGVGALLLGVRRLAGAGAALWAAAFWAVNPLAIGYAQTLRAHALAALFLIGCLLALPGLARAATMSRRWSAALLMGLCGLGLIYTHFIGGLFLAAIGMVWLCDALFSSDRRRWGAWLPGLAAWGMVIAGFAPWAQHLGQQYQLYTAHSLPPKTIWPSLADLYLGPFFTTFFGDPKVQPGLRWVLGILMTLCLILGLRGRGAGESANPATSAGGRGLAWRAGLVFLLAFVGAWLPSWREALRLYTPALPLLAAAGALAAALALAAAIPDGRSATKALWCALLLMGLTSLVRPLSPQRHAALWTTWNHKQPMAVLRLLEGDPIKRTPASLVVFPDYWAGLIPADGNGQSLIPYTQWAQDPRSRKEKAILLTLEPHFNDALSSGSGRMCYVLASAMGQNASRVDSAPVLTQHGRRLSIRTSILKPYDPDKAYGEYERLRQAVPQAEAFAQCRTAQLALELPPSPVGFYAVEHDDKMSSWRWTRGGRCQLSIPGPLPAGASEVLVCLDRPAPYPTALEKWPWTLADDDGKEIGKGTMEIPCGGPIVFRLPVKLDRPMARLELSFSPHPWQPWKLISGSEDRRMLGGRLFWAGVAGATEGAK